MQPAESLKVYTVRPLPDSHAILKLYRPVIAVSMNAAILYPIPVFKSLHDIKGIRGEHGHKKS